MAKVTINSLASAVATLLGESLALECLPEESPFPGIEERVNILAPGMLTELMLEFPQKALQTAKSIPGLPEIDAEGIGALSVPEDFLILVSVKMKSWNQPVVKLTETGNRHYPCRTSKWTGIRGNPERPVVTREFNGKGEDCLRLYSCSRDDNLEHALYLPLPTVTDGYIEIPGELYHPLLEKLRAKIASE